MSPNYATNDMDKLREDNYFHWEYNMRMKLARKGLVGHLVPADRDEFNDRTTARWKENDLKALGVIADGVDPQHQVYIRHAVSAEQAWVILLEQYNRSTMKNRIAITKQLHSFKMEPGTRISAHVDKFQELVMKMSMMGEHIDEGRQIVLLLSSLTEEYRVISSVLENTPNVNMLHVVETLTATERDSGELPAAESAFSVSKKAFKGKCFHCNKPGHRKADCKQFAREQHGARKAKRADKHYAFATDLDDDKSVWLVDSGASSHMTSWRDKFDDYEDLQAPIAISIADGTKIDAVGVGSVTLGLLDGMRVTLTGVLHIPELDGNLISIAKLASKGVDAEFSKSQCTFRFEGEVIMAARRQGSVYKLNTSEEQCSKAQQVAAAWGR